MNKAQITSFVDLTVWQRGRRLVLETYRITRLFPREEVYALTDQMRRSVISITSNIAEGFSRKSYKEKIQFYHMSLGSLTELQNQFLIARDIGYINDEGYKEIADLTVEVHKLLNGFIKGARNYARA